MLFTCNILCYASHYSFYYVKKQLLFSCWFGFAIVSDLVVITTKMLKYVSSIDCSCSNYWKWSVLNAVTLTWASTCSLFSPTLACRRSGLVGPARNMRVLETLKWVQSFTLVRKSARALCVLALLIRPFCRLVQHGSQGFSLTQSPITNQLVSILPQIHVLSSFTSLFIIILTANLRNA